ncbi:MAG: hypothetical protein M3R70_11820 [Actinomycetota bacterium]|nr:hypothetical protein [Actinomycetota bacterium]
MEAHEEVWIPLVDEPIGSIVAKIQEQHPEITKLVGTPHRLLAFRTFAYIRVGILLGQLLVEEDLEPYNGSDTWIDALLRDPKLYEQVVEEVQTVAKEIAADPRYADDAMLGPDEPARERFRRFAERQLSDD